MNIGIDPYAEVYVIATPGARPEIVPFDLVLDRVERYALNLFIEDTPTPPRGSLLAYDTMLELLDALRAHYEATGEQAVAELTPDLLGLDGQRVRVVDDDGEREFTVGRSDGFLPHHEEVTPNGRRRAQLAYGSVEEV